MDELREKFLGGLTPFADFAAAIGKHPKTLARMKPPIVRVGRRLYVPDDRGRKWIMEGCPPVLPEAPQRRGKRAA